MRRSSLLVFAAVVTTGLWHAELRAVPPPTIFRDTPSSAEAEEAILAADDQFWQAAGDHDVARMSGLFADQYFGLTPDGTRWDKASCLAQHERVRTANLKRTQARQVTLLRPDAAVLSYAATFDIVARDGTPLDSASQAMASYWILQDGRWQVMFAHVAPANAQAQ